MFPNAYFALPSLSSEPVHWAVVGPSNAGKTTFLELLRGLHSCQPPTARTFPYLGTAEIECKDPRLRSPTQAIQYVGFNGRGNGLGPSSVQSAYMSARYESRREETDFSVLDYLKGQTELNSDEAQRQGPSRDDLTRVLEDLDLSELAVMPVANLSNGQTRRVRIAKALLNAPELLLLDEPFMGLDPLTLSSLSSLLHGLAKAASPRLLLALRPQDPIPDWITHVLRLGPSLRISDQGSKAMVMAGTSRNASRPTVMSANGSKRTMPPQQESSGEALVEMNGVQVRYGQKTVLGGWSKDGGSKDQGGLWWTVRRSQRWGIFGPNGSGKTTLMSLICSDHPQAYSLPLKIFGRGRLPELGLLGISIFDIQARIGQSSPEVHRFFPKSLSIRRTIQSAWADTFLGTPKLSNCARSAIDLCLRHFEPELNPSFDGQVQINLNSYVSQSGDLSWADEARFGQCTFSTQRVALLLRALVKKPDLVVLDEAFSGMDEHVRNKCMHFLEQGIEGFGGLEQRQALICISHLKEEVPPSVQYWLCLPDTRDGKAARFGRLEGSLAEDEESWNKIWGTGFALQPS